MQSSRIQHRSIAIDGVDVSHRDVGPPDAPALSLLHGFPASSQQDVRLMDRLSDRLRVIALDYPGFGYRTSCSLPQAELHMFNTGHFALQELVDEIGTYMVRADER